MLPCAYVNSGNKCFINAPLQAILALPTVAAKLEDLRVDVALALSMQLMKGARYKQHADAKNRADITNDLRLAFTYQHSMTSDMCVVQRYLFTGRFYHGVQEDAHQFAASSPPPLPLRRILACFYKPLLKPRRSFRRLASRASSTRKGATCARVIPPQAECAGGGTCYLPRRQLRSRAVRRAPPSAFAYGVQLLHARAHTQAVACEGL